MSLSATEVAGFQATASGQFSDECQIGTDTGTSTTEDPDAPSWSYATAIACGFDASVSTEVVELGQATMTDATIRVPLGTSVTGASRVRLTKRYGASLSPVEDYEVLGAPRRGVSCLVLHCKLTVGNTAR